MLERVASVVEPTLTQIPPNLIRPTLAPAVRSRQDGTRAAAARPGDGRGDRSAHGRGAPDPRPLVRIRGAQRHARDRRDHRRLHGAVDAGHRLRALPSRDGRDQRQARRLELRARRHGRPDAGARRGGARAWASRSRPRPKSRAFSHARPRRPASRSTSGEEFAAKRIASGVDCHVTFERLLEPASCRTSFATRSRASRTAARRARSTSRSSGFRASPRCPATSPARSTSEPCISAPTKISSSAPTTTLSTARRRASRSSSARCLRHSIRPSRRPANT